MLPNIFLNYSVFAFYSSEEAKAPQKKVTVMGGHKNSYSANY